MPALYFTVGLPRSGKSHYLAQLEKPANSVIVEVDKIRLAFGHRFNSEVEPFVEATKVAMCKTLLLSGYTVYVDDTHTTVGSIRKILEIDQNAIPILIDTPVNECIKRARAGGAEDLVESIERCHFNLSRMAGNNLNYPSSLEENLLEAVERIKEGIQKLCVDPVYGTQNEFQS